MKKFPWAAKQLKKSTKLPKVVDEAKRLAKLEEKRLKELKKRKEKEKRRRQVYKYRLKSIKKAARGKARANKAYHKSLARRGRPPKLIQLRQRGLPMRSVFVPLINGKPARWKKNHFVEAKGAGKKFPETLSYPTLKELRTDIKCHGVWEKKNRVPPSTITFLRVKVDVYAKSNSKEKRKWLKQMLEATNKQPADTILSFPQFVYELYQLSLAGSLPKNYRIKKTKRNINTKEDENDTNIPTS